MKKIEISKDALTEYWVVYIDGVASIKSKSLLRVTKSLYKFTKGQAE